MKTEEIIQYHFQFQSSIENLRQRFKDKINVQVEDHSEKNQDLGCGFSLGKSCPQITLSALFSFPKMARSSRVLDPEKVL